MPEPQAAVVPRPSPPPPVPQGDIDPSTPGGQAMLDLMTFAGMLVNSGLFSRYTPQVILMRILTGRSYGLPPLAALDAFQVIEGRVSPSASFQLALVNASRRVTYRVTKNDSEGSAVEWFRDGRPVGTSTFNVADYKQAQLGQSASGKAGAWQKYPKQMMLYRAFTQGMKVYGAHLLFGLDFAMKAEGSDYSFVSVPLPATGDAATIAEAVAVIESDDDLGQVD